MDHALLRTKTLVTVGISEFAISKEKGDAVITYSLGSCAGVSFFDPDTGVGGMIHCMLPLSGSDKDKARETPAMYVDSGIMLILQKMFDMGVQRNNLICRVAGCGSPADAQGLFKIGERNYTVLRKILWKNNILIKGELIGGVDPKTMVLDLATGKTFVRIHNQFNEI